MNSSFCGLKTTSVFDYLFREICVSCRFRPRKRRQFCSFAWTVLLAAFSLTKLCLSKSAMKHADLSASGAIARYEYTWVCPSTYFANCWICNVSLAPIRCQWYLPVPPCASLSTYDEVHKLVIAWWYMVVIDWHDVCRTKCYYPPTHPPQYEEVGPAQKNDIMCCSPGFQTSLFTEKNTSEIIGQNQGMVRWHGQYRCDVSSIIQHRGCSCITIALRWRPLWENPRKKPLFKKDG